MNISFDPANQRSVSDSDRVSMTQAPTAYRISFRQSGRVPSGPETVNGTRCNAGKSAVSMLTPAAPL